MLWSRCAAWRSLHAPIATEPTSHTHGGKFRQTSRGIPRRKYGASHRPTVRSVPQPTSRYDSVHYFSLNFFWLDFFFVPSEGGGPCVLWSTVGEPERERPR